MPDILNQIALFAAIFGPPLVFYIHWKSRQIHLISTAELSISLTLGEVPFSVIIVNKNPRQARIDQIGFEADYGDMYEIRYAVELLKVSQVLLTDGEKIQIHILGSKVTNDLVRGIRDIKKDSKKQITGSKVKIVRGWVYISTGKKFPIELSDNLKGWLLTETQLSLAPNRVRPGI